MEEQKSKVEQKPKEEQNTKEEKKPKRKSINRRMYVLIALLVFFSSMLGLVNSTTHYLHEHAESFREKNNQIAAGTASYFYNPQLADFGDLVLSDEYAALRAETEWGGDRTALDQCIEKHDLTSFAERTRGILTRMQNIFDVDSTYIAACDGTACYFVIGPHDYGILEGEKLQYTLTPEEISAGESVSTRYIEFVEPGTYGSEKTVYANDVSISPVGDPNGKYTYWMASESDLLLLASDEMNYILRTILFMVIEILIFGLIGASVMRKQLTVPIISIKDNAVRFTTENSATQAAKPQDSGIRSNDELEDLSDSLFKLEENVSTTQDELRRISEERGRLSAELSIANSIQHGVLPNEFPHTESYELHALMDPAREVGGDFYDFFRLDDDNICLVIGDVSDKGIPAALFMMTSKTMLKSHAFSTHNPAETLEAVNKALCDSNPAEMFVTVWIGILNLKSGLLTAANGGHEYPMFRLGDKPFEVMDDPHGLVLGAFGTAKYKNYEVEMKPGDRLFVYSDGATDAVDTNIKDYGLDRLLATVQEGSKSEKSEDLIMYVKEKLDEYSKDAYQFDDITMLALKYFGPGDQAGSNGTEMSEE